MSVANIEQKKRETEIKYHLFSILKSSYTKNNIYCDEINKIILLQAHTFLKLNILVLLRIPLLLLLGGNINRQNYS